MADSDSANSTKDVNRERRFIIVCVCLFVCLFVYAGVSPANVKILNCQINL